MDSKSPTKRAIYNSIKQDLFDGDTITLIAERNDASRCLVRRIRDENCGECNFNI